MNILFTPGSGFLFCVFEGSRWGHGAMPRCPPPKRLSFCVCVCSCACVEEHRRRISEAIRAKWQDEEYRARAVAAIQKV